MNGQLLAQQVEQRGYKIDLRDRRMGDNTIQFTEAMWKEQQASFATA